MIAAAITPSLWAMTQTPQPRAIDNDDVVLDSVTERRRKAVLPEGIKLPTDTQGIERLVHPTYLLARSYGDSIVLRWAYDNYALWQVAKYGNVDIMRIDESEPGSAIDTIARDIRAFTLAEMEKAFAPTDSLAGVAAQAMYGKSAKLSDVNDQGFGYNPIMEVYSQQQTLYAYALLAS